MNVRYRLPRGTRSSLQAQAAAGALLVGQEYFLTDELVVAVAYAPNQFVTLGSGTSGLQKIYAPATTGESFTIGSITQPVLLTDTLGQILIVEVD